MKRKQHNSGDLLFKGNMVIVVNCPVFSMINNRPRELEIVLLHQLKTHVEHKAGLYTLFSISTQYNQFNSGSPVRLGVYVFWFWDITDQKFVCFILLLNFSNEIRDYRYTYNYWQSVPLIYMIVTAIIP